MTTTKDDYNPFEDPSIRNLTNQPTNQDSLGNYNPFDERKLQQPESPVKSVTVSITPTHSEMQQPVENPPPYSNSAAQNQAQNDLQKRQEELERKANELQAREERLNALPSPTGQVKNWPPLPAKCCVGPCFYQDIGVEIPISYQKTVRTMYYLWWCYAVLLFLNMLGALALFISNSEEGTTFGISIVLFVIFSPMSYLCWFRPAYKAFRADSSFNFMVFFFVFFFQFCVAVFYAIGIPQMGSCGLLNGIKTLSSKGEHTIDMVAVGVIAVVIGFLWAILALAFFYMLCLIHKMYRGTTASFAKAQEELASGVMRNQHVQAAATQAATTAVQQSLNNAATGLRY